jgi:peptide/nickel transport system substrate-binding protein
MLHRAFRLAAVFSLLLLPSGVHAQSVVRQAAEADLVSVDPIWTSAHITAGHAYLIYDNLFAQDSTGIARPQMVESWKASADGLTWTFVLRPGLKFHDGTPVTTRDAIASIKRWGARYGAGQNLMARTREIAAIDDRTFEIRLKEKFGPVIEMLGAPTVVHVMREKDAQTDPGEQVTTSIGSGPFLFEREKWLPGNRWSYRKNPDYVPRSDKADGYAGGKVVNIDGLEVVYIADTSTAVQALIRGEVDFYEYVPSHLLPVVEKERGVVTRVVNRGGFNPLLRLNHQVAPTSNQKFRQAVLLAMNQKDTLAAIVGNPSLEKPCWAVFACGYPLETDAGTEGFAQASAANIEKAKQLLKETGYGGDPFVLLNPAENQSLSAVITLTAQQLRQIGINVDLQAMDFGTLVQRRTLKDDPKVNRAGWHIFPTQGPTQDRTDPLTASILPTHCDGKNWFGWPCDEELEAMRLKFAAISDLAERKAHAQAFQRRFYETVPYVPLGMFFQKAAWRSNVDGILDNFKIVWWNATKK